MLSFFGPRHGRLLQGNFNQSGILKIRASPIYSFVRKTEAPFDLFLRYYSSEPQDGPDYEFYYEEDALSQVPEYVSPSNESDKENVTPKE